MKIILAQTKGKGEVIYKEMASTMSAGRALRLFVGNLPWTVSRKELSEYFSKFGTLRSATVVFNDQSGFSLGYGFIEFASKDGYNKAVSQDHHMLEHNKLSLGAAYTGNKQNQQQQTRNKAPSE